MSEGGVVAQLRKNSLGFKEVLKQEIECFRASRKFDDLAAYQKKLREIETFIDYFIDKDVLAVLANHKQQLHNLPNPPCFDIFDIVQGTVPQKTFDALERFEKAYTAWLDKVMPYLKGGGVEAT